MARSAAKFSLNAAQQKLVEDNLNLARREAWRYHRKTEIDYKTLESVAFEGLCQAAWRYDQTMLNDRTGEPMKFSSIAVPYTRGAILHHIRDRTYLLRLSHKMRENWLRGRKLIYKGKSDQEIADLLGIKLSEWLDTKVTCSGPPLELKESGAPTVDAAIADVDCKPFYVSIAQQAIKGLDEAQLKKLEAYFSGSGKPPTELLECVLAALEETDCPDKTFWE